MQDWLARVSIKSIQIYPFIINKTAENGVK